MGLTSNPTNCYNKFLMWSCFLSLLNCYDYMLLLSKKEGWMQLISVAYEICLEII